LKLSIIIPVLNEQDAILECLDSLQTIRDQGHEVIVVDAGSEDDTVSLARPIVDKVLKSKPGRAAQMNTGARLAHGDLLLFLHVDTMLPVDAITILQEKMQEHGNHPHGNHLWGRFDMHLDSQHWMFRVIETMMNLRSRLTSVSTGDQAIFVSRDLFNSVGGFPEIALMEDIAISKLLREHALPVNLRQRVTSSTRRWQNRGILNTIWLMWKLRLYYFLGASPERLARMYR